MKDFCKWLGVSEKIAKLVVWLFIGMAFLIVTNIMLESIGLPYYKITVDNLSNIDTNVLIEYVSAWLMCFLNFYSITLLVFRVSELKNMFKYALLYLILNALINELLGYFAVQIYIPIYIVLFCYFYSKKNWKYSLYGIVSLIINSFVQYICYLYKLRFIDYENINHLVKSITSIDFLVIMFVVIFVKEIIIKKKKKG